ncbi:FAD binding domain-domain-containing protein [Aspergillus taichungensis]|uniref:FAD binding domain-domain-containing protein n=1 Tax=Aspergillus taichungensis TaxID=482145 RepID=A0A2J5IA84_9EURO|nr:FAD binding domain-domain-containing protein [Aspergillus taichungensis]
MATTNGGFTFSNGYRQEATTNPWDDSGNSEAWDGQEPHYSVPPSVELLTSTVHNHLGHSYLRTWPTIYNGTASPHGVPDWWKPPSQVDVLICGADGVQPRFLEILGTWGLAEEVAEEGPLIERTAIYKDGKPLLHGRSHQSDSRYRGLHVITQGQIERIYVRDLYRHQVLVDRNTTLKKYQVEDQDGSDPWPVKGIISNNETGEEELVEAKFLVGSDGGASSIRRSLGVPFDGVSTDIYWGIMDCIFESDYPHAWLFGSVINSNHGGCVIIPREQGYIRLYTQLDVSQTGPIAQSRLAKDASFQESGGHVDVHSITADEVLEQANRIFAPYKLRFAAPLSWFTVWKISERVARSFSSKDLRVHLAGDAAHIHSVMGAFGLNASILDSSNLAWKLGLCCSGAADMQSLMPTYDKERRLHAARIIETSGQYLRFVCNSELPVANLYRLGADLGCDLSGDESGSPKKSNGAHGTNGINGEDARYVPMLNRTLAPSMASNQSNGLAQNTNDADEEAIRSEDLAFLHSFFGQNGQFLLGTDCAYGSSCLTPRIVANLHGVRRASTLCNGVRAPSPRVCFNTGSTGYLYDRMKGADRFHLLVFGSDLQGPGRGRLASFSRALGEASGFYTRFGGAKRFNVLLIAKGAPFEVDALLRGDSDLTTLREEAVIVSDDRTPEDDAHSVYGVDHSTGAVVVVRPDLWVGTVATPDQTLELDAYFSSFLISVEHA